MNRGFKNLDKDTMVKYYKLDFKRVRATCLHSYRKGGEM
jgi:hypothetical protein